jgi:hypothetical protein
MKYGPWRLFVLIGLIAALVIIVIVLIVLILKKKCFTLVIDNVEQQDICLGAFSSYTVSSYSIPDLGKITKSLFGDFSFTYSKNTTTPGITVKLVEDLPVEIEYEEENYKKNSVSLMIKKTERSSDTSLSQTGESGIY